MARPPEQRQELRRAYVYDRLPLEAAADKAGIPLGTARRWKADAENAGDDWEKARAAASLSATGANTVAQMVLADFLTLHGAVVDELRNAPDVPALAKAEALSRLADAFTKTMAAVAKAAPDLGRFAVATELLADYARFVRDRFPDLEKAVIETLEPFGVCIAEKYGK